MPELRPRIVVAPCKVADARRAVMAWHYSRRMPVGRLVCHGIWEDDRFVGAIIYGRGATPTLGRKYGCSKTEVCELVRVALANGRKNPTSAVVARSLRLLQKGCPDLKLVMSFADPAQGHLGIMYQALNWSFHGMTSEAKQYFCKGRWCHPREVTSGAFGKGGRFVDLHQFPTRVMPGKYRYCYAFDLGTRQRLALVAESYPKKSVCAGSIAGDVAAPQAEEGGSTPTPALHVSAR